jgi:flagellar motility protein MotE (MotC chaperone)
MARQATRILTLFAAAALSLAAPAAMQAQDVRYRNREGTLSRTGYDRMRRMAQQLDAMARQANDQARYDQSDQYRRDTKFLRSIDEFARAAAQFRARMNTYRTRPWNVDEELQRLIKEARDVQQRIRRARFADARTRETWDRVVDLLQRMTSEYRNGTRLADADGRYRDGDFRDRDYRDDDYRDENGYYQNDFSQLARELDERANRRVEVSRRSVPFGYDYGDSLGRFAEQARDFRGRVDGGRLSQQQLQLIVRRLVEEAQQAQSDFSRPGVSREMRTEWDGAMQTLQRIRQAAAV